MKNMENKNDRAIGHIIALSDGGVRFEDENQNVLGDYHPKDNRVTNQYYHLIGEGNERAADLLYEIFVIWKSGMS